MKFTLKTIIEASAKDIYNAWLDSTGHTKMTGGEATIDDGIGSNFTAWDGYIKGENLELDIDKRIVQSWRTSDFHEKDEDSKIEITLDEEAGKTVLTLVHTNLPENGEQYRQGWGDHYFEPMREYFNGK